MDIIGVQAADFDRVVRLIEWHLESFAERSHGEMTVSDLVHEIKDEKRQCWIAFDGKVRACALTQVHDSYIRVVEVTHCAGKGRGDWQDAIINEIREWAKSIGAGKFRTVNRPGYTKFLRGMGLKETHRVMEQTL